MRTPIRVPRLGPILLGDNVKQAKIGDRVQVGGDWLATKYQGAGVVTGAVGNLCLVEYDDDRADAWFPYGDLRVVDD